MIGVLGDFTRPTLQQLYICRLSRLRGIKGAVQRYERRPKIGRPRPAVVDVPETPSVLIQGGPLVWVHLPLCNPQSSLFAHKPTAVHWEDAPCAEENENMHACGVAFPVGEYLCRSARGSKFQLGAEACRTLPICPPPMSGEVTDNRSSSFGLGNPRNHAPQTCDEAFVGYLLLRLTTAPPLGGQGGVGERTRCILTTETSIYNGPENLVVE